MTLEQFQNHPPSPGSINILYSGSNITAISISNINCLGVNISSSLKNLKIVTVTIDNVRYDLPVLLLNSKNNYYTYTVSPTFIPNTRDRGCTDTAIVPALVDGTFDKSDYDALKNNVSINTTTGYIFDVDRSTFTLLPTNFKGILSGSATPASFQEFNHSSIGIISGRYEGSKTTKESYGTIPSISIGTFDGVTYNSNVADSFICSQSLQERNIEILGMNTEFNKTNINPDGTPTFTKNTSISAKSGYVSGSSGNPATLNSTDTTMEVNWLRVDIAKLQQNALYHFMTDTTEEFFILKSYELIGQSVDGFTPVNTYRITVARGASGVAFSHEGGVLSSYNINIKRVESDQIFEFNGNKLTTLSNRKVYIPLRNTIVYTGIEGMIYSGSLGCS